MTVSVFLGIDTEIFLRLWVSAPMISIVSDMGIGGEDAIFLFYSIEMRIQLFF
jgi:hypothetical protein